MYEYTPETREELRDFFGVLSQNISEIKALIPQLQYHQAELVDKVNAGQISTEDYADQYWELELEVREADKHIHAWEAGLLLETAETSEQQATFDQLRKRLDLMRRVFSTL